ncbi:MAG: hypothetical protein QW341_02160 [Candidatus Bathyarchaeia archaeon]
MLERDVARIFSLIGLKASLNVRLDGHEIDILVTYDSMKIAVECKQYESGRLGVRDLIYKWATKRRELGLDKVLLVVVGHEVKPAERMLAGKYDITIWDEEDFERAFMEAINRKEGARDYVLKSMGIEPSTHPIAEEALHPTMSALHGLLAFYKLVKFIAFVWIFFGWIFMDFVEAPSMWFLMTILFIIVVICLRMGVSKEKEKAVLNALSYISGGWGGVPSWKLAQALNMKQDEIEKILNILLQRGKVKLTDGRWELA